MSREVQITISSKMKDVEGLEYEVSENTYHAKHIEKDGVYYIFYEEGEKSAGTFKQSKLILCANGVVELVQKGATNSNMIFAEEKQHKFLYQTPYSCIDMEVFAKQVDLNLEAGMGEIVLDYELSANGELYAICEMKIGIDDKKKC